MSSRWVTGICLGCGLALVISGIVQTFYYRPRPLPVSVHERSTSLEGATSSLSIRDQKADLEIADELTRKLKDRTGVTVSRVKHADSSPAR